MPNKPKVKLATKPLKISKKPTKNVRELVVRAKQPTPDQVLDTLQEYLNELEETGKPPSLARFASKFGVSPATVRLWCKENEQLDKAYVYLKTLQEAELEEKALTNKFNPNFATFLLKSKHNYKDQPTTLVQNNLGIGGEWLTNALQDLKRSTEK